MVPLTLKEKYVFNILFCERFLPRGTIDLSCHQKFPVRTQRTYEHMGGITYFIS